MVDSVSNSVNENSKLKETITSEDSVPTDLTVSVNALSQDQEISEISDLVDDDKRTTQQRQLYHQEIVKRLRSELQLQKILLSQKNAEAEKIQTETKQEVELLKQHVHLSTRENEALKKENAILSEEILDLQTKYFRSTSENKIFEENAAKLRESISGLEKNLTDLTAKHKRTLNSIENGEFTVQEFERIKANQNSLVSKCQMLDKENESLRKSTNKWKRKFTNLRNDYETRMHSEVEKLRKSLQKQIEMLRVTGTEMMESRLQQTEQNRDKAAHQVAYWKNQAEKLKFKLRELEIADNKKRSQLEQMESTKNELVQRLNSVSSSKARLERDLQATRQESQNNVENLKENISSLEKKNQELQHRVESQMKSLQEYEESFLAMYSEEDSNRWPILLKIQSQHTTRMTKRVTQLETENEFLQKQQTVFTSKISQLEKELESKEKIMSQVQRKAPETIGLFRDKDALLRELRSQLNQKDLQLMEYARQVERLKRTRNQLVSDLEEVLRDRSALEAVKEMLK